MSKKRHHDTRHGDDIHEFSEKEERKANRGVLGVESADKFLFGFDKIERWPVQFRCCSYDEHKEREQASSDDIPVDKTILGLHNAVRTQCAGRQQYRRQAETESCFVRNHLGSGPNRSEERVL
jgi:hypothetical protein